jgi:hypothetical protein
VSLHALLLGAAITLTFNSHWKFQRYLTAEKLLKSGTSTSY